MIARDDARRRMLRLRIALLRSASDVEHMILDLDSGLLGAGPWLEDDAACKLREHLETIEVSARKVLELGPEPPAIRFPAVVRVEAAQLVNGGVSRESMITRLREAHPQLSLDEIHGVVDFTLAIAAEADGNG